MWGRNLDHLSLEVSGQLRGCRSGKDTAEREDDGLRSEDKEDLSACGRISGDPCDRTGQASPAQREAGNICGLGRRKIMVYIANIPNVPDVIWIKKCRRLSSPTRRGK